MEVLIIMIVVIVVLMCIKTPKSLDNSSSPTSEARLRQLRKKGAKRPPGGLPWMGNAKRRRK